MSLFNWMWDFGQDSKISDQEEKLEKLQKRVEVLEDWIRYYEAEKIRLARKDHM